MSITAREQTRPLNLTFNMHNSHGQRITCRKVGKEQTNSNGSPSDLCLISLQSISRIALGKGSCATAVMWVLLTWNLDTSENVRQQRLYWRCNFLAARAAKNKVLPSLSSPPYLKKKTQGFLITTAKLQSTEPQHSIHQWRGNTETSGHGLPQA